MSDLQKYERAELLSLDNPELLRAALKLRRKPDRLIKQLKETFPTRVEQALAINIMAEFSHRPETIKKVLVVLMNGADLREQDLIPSAVTGISLIEQMLPLMEEILNLILRVPNDYQGLRLGCKRASKLIMIYGEKVDDFLSSVVDDLQFVGDILHMSRSTNGDIMRRALHVWEVGIIPYCEKHAMPYPITLREFFEDHGSHLDLETIDEEDEEGFHGAVPLSRYTEVMKTVDKASSQ